MNRWSLPPGRRRVACFGECMIELRERPDGLLSRGFGGDTLNTAVYLARLGVPVDYVTALGDDPHSEEMLHGWQAEGVGTGFVARMPGRVPGLYLIQTDARGERRFSYWRGEAPVRQLLDAPDAVAAAFGAAGVIYLSGVSLSLFGADARERLFALLDDARRAGCRIVFDSNFRPRGWPDPAAARAAFDRMLRSSDTVLAGVEDFLLLGHDMPGSALLRHLHDAGVTEAVVKLAEPGCLLVIDGTERHVPVPELRVPHDTTAAGDSFAAAYVAARLGGAGTAEAALAGHRLAAIVIGFSGAIIPIAAMPERP